MGDMLVLLSPTCYLFHWIPQLHSLVLLVDGEPYGWCQGGLGSVYKQKLPVPVVWANGRQFHPLATYFIG